MVQPGDTAGRIAGRFGVPEEALYEANPFLKQGTVIVAGLQLQLPLPQNPLAKPNSADITKRIVQASHDYGYPDLCYQIARLQRLYPFIWCENIGRSVSGRAIHALRIGQGDKAVQINASFHANEWITSLLAMRFIEDVARSLSLGEKLLIRSEGEELDIQALSRQVTLWIVPMVNPDGVELVQGGVGKTHPRYAELKRLNRGSEDFSEWKANINGVDLNDQFPAHWEEEVSRRGHDGPGPRDYPGLAPLGEPEARTLYEFTKEKQFATVLALHTQGEEIYWNYRGYEPAAAEDLAGKLAAASGYKAVKLEGSDAGFKDWFIQEFGRPGFTVEAGLGVNPLPIAQFDKIYANIQQLLLAAVKL
ncbi:LysM peptidoglycan-binding domain-containing protein [Paenibacillus sp. MAHUQ-46]|uniref:LysM peptidoglycan-binding domain-containing protein n=2 Tax=Paenibacillus TaxID=44249 RepID=A0A934MNW0_9BACL|nr:LysM peptidoglycan-binding domain-containing protein [Paenibacillus roseus]